MNQLVALPEAARILGVSIFTVRRLADAGFLKTVYVASRRLIPIGELERAIAMGAGKRRIRKGARPGRQ
jgi:predicted site-specific integrase-resolvase